MDLLDGSNLRDYIGQNDFDDDDIQYLFLQMLSAISHLHRHQIIHRDLKPSNFIVDNTREVKLIDFGIVKNIQKSSAGSIETRTSFKMGTPLYMSPEQLLDSKNIDHRSDIFSLGVVLWEMVTRRSVNESEGIIENGIHHLSVYGFLPLTHTKWDPMIKKATNRNPQSRYRDCGEWISELKEGSNEIYFETTQNVSLKSSTINLYPYLDVRRIESVKIQNQVWMSRNLDTTYFKNGDVIPEAATSHEWKEFNRLKKPAWCKYTRTNLIDDKKGKIYNWYALIDSRGLAPDGWIIPRKKDWDELIKSILPKASAGASLKAKSVWKRRSIYSAAKRNNNSTNFSALPGGMRTTDGKFTGLGIVGTWWSISDESDKVFVFRLDSELDNCITLWTSKNFGFYVRCLMNT
jgi:uncharacterized protein (TIGR02145 family)